MTPRIKIYLQKSMTNLLEGQMRPTSHCKNPSATVSITSLGSSAIKLQFNRFDVSNNIFHDPYGQLLCGV